MTSAHTLAIIALVLVVIALLLAAAALLGSRRASAAAQENARRLARLERRGREDHRAHAPHDGDDDAEDRDPVVAAVFNPSKFSDPERAKREIAEAVGRSGGGEVLFYETTEEDPGKGQTVRAVHDGADIVLAVGGDGTVRMVASGLADSGKTMGIVPMGTGNLLARNLSIPLDDIPAAVRIALDPRGAQRIDVGWLRQGDSLEEIEIAEKQIFLVMAGFGADAEVIGATNAKMKKRIGWIAYVIAGFTKVVGRSHDVRITLPGEIVHQVRARTVLVGNVGKLPGGIVLMPDATIDNGRLEVLAMGWRNAAGLSQIGAQLIAPSLRRSGLLKLSSMERFLVRRVRLEASRPQPVQLDGDTSPAASVVVAEVDPGALIVRAPIEG